MAVAANRQFVGPLSASDQEGSKCASGTTDACMEKSNPVIVNYNSHCTKKDACSTCRTASGTCWSTSGYVEIPITE